MVAFTSIHILEVLGDCLVHVVALTDELVSFDHGSHHWVSTLDLQDLLCSCVKRLHIPRSEVPLECVQDLVVVKLTCEL